MNWRNAIQTIFFGNYFYGICAVALAIETSIQQAVPLISPLFYALLFFATVLYYSHAYVVSSDSITDTKNMRAKWYVQHHRKILFSQALFTIFICLLLLLLFNGLQPLLKNVPLISWFLFAGLLTTVLLYYGNWRIEKTPFTLRNKGIVKPFLIGFAWACTVSLLPLMFYDLENKTNKTYTNITLFLFIKNWLYISVLCILFDIKDYATDANQALKTFVVQLGLRKTIFRLVIPLCVVAHCFFLLAAYTKGFYPTRIVFNTIPFVLLIIVAWSMHRRKSILYYLAIIDGLMLLKALCGIAGSMI